MNCDNADYEYVLSFFGLNITDIPVVRLITSHGVMQKFKPDSSDIKFEILINFVNAFFDGKLKQDLLSQEIPDDWNDAPVKILVGKNFHEVATDKKKTVLVAFIAPW